MPETIHQFTTMLKALDCQMICGCQKDTQPGGSRHSQSDNITGLSPSSKGKGTR